MFVKMAGVCHLHRVAQNFEIFRSRRLPFTCTRPNTMPSRLRDRGISNIVFFVIQANACPIAMRMAWHASGTYDKSDGSGGCNGILCTCHLFLISRRTSAVRCEQTLLSFELIFS
jgi:hypothetical protein